MIITYFTILALGLALVTTLIVLGSIASNKFDFSFSYLSILSLIIYFSISCMATKIIAPIAGVTLVGLLGLYEATVGLKLILRFGANIEDLTEDINDILDEDYNPHPGLVITMVLVYMLIGWLGTLFA